MTDVLPLLLAGAAGALLGGLAPKRRRAPETAVVMFAIDGLDTLRADHGDEAAAKLESRIAGVLRRTVPRGGRFEHRSGEGRFAMTVTGMPFDATGGLAESARRLAMLSTVETGDRRVGRTVSAAAVQQRGDASAAVVRADRLLNEAQRQGGDLVIADGPAQDLVETADVLDGIRAGEMSYHVQPIRSLGSGRVVGLEALMRWTRRGRVVRSPARFLHRLDWLPEDAIRTTADLAVAAARPFVEADARAYVAFNVTAAALEDRRSPAGRWLARILDRLPPDRIVLELLESTVLARPIVVGDAVDALRRRGVRFALDDFGTGLSNFDRLLMFRPDVVKIDRSFIPQAGARDASREAVLDALVSLGLRLGTALVAEGMEDERDVDTARRHGIAFGQGYHLGRPGPAAEWVARLGPGDRAATG